ncbi:ECF-type sigma factor [Isosphaeraceae bacterium EP7]
MGHDSHFNRLVERLRAGDEDAVAELVRDYEPFIRRSIRLRLRDQRLRRMFDSMDICQSVLASFCVRAALGQYDLDEPSQLPKLLNTMARNKLAHEVQRLRAGRRDYRRAEPMESGFAGPASTADSPSEMISRGELLSEFRSHLTEEEKQIVALRDSGLDWVGLAARMGGTPDGRRMQLTRAISRIALALRINSFD